MSADEVDEVKNEETPEITNNEVNEEEAKNETNETIEEDNNKAENEEDVKKEEIKPKAKTKKQARSVKVVELVECGACNQKMTPKSLRYTHPTYCKGQPRETLPVNKQKASYGAKVKEQLRKEIEEEMKAEYAVKAEPSVKNEVVVNYSEHEVACSSATLHEPIEVANAREAMPSVKTKQKPVIIEEKPPPKQLTATELVQQHYQENGKPSNRKRLRKLTGSKAVCFNIDIIFI